MIVCLTKRQKARFKAETHVAKAMNTGIKYQL